MKVRFAKIAGVLAIAVGSQHAQAAANEHAQLETLASAVEPRVIAWRRNIHEHPELSNREVKTAKLVAEHLQRLGLAVETGIAHTGVVALLEGARPGPTLALRADMDALPVVEKTDVPFKSRVTSTYGGQTVGVMHACGHDAHVAIMMGVADVLTKMRESLRGRVLFVFQPAEEGVPPGEEGGASLMLKEGLFAKYSPDAAFGLHVWSALHAGEVGVRVGPFLAAADSYKITVTGKQTHGSRPWQGVDPILASAQIITALQSVTNKAIDITTNPAVVSIGSIHSGVRQNIIPGSAEMLGTIRTFDQTQRTRILDSMRRIVESTAEANGAQGRLEVLPGSYPVVLNDVDTTNRMLPTLQRAVGSANVKIMPPVTGSEDFAFFAQQVPSLYFFVGVTPPDEDVATVPTNHSDFFYLDEHGLSVGLRAMTALAFDFLTTPAAQ